MASSNQLGFIKHYSCCRKLWTNITVCEKLPPETITRRNIGKRYGWQCQRNWLTNVEAGASESDFITRMGANHFLLTILDKLPTYKRYAHNYTA